MINPFSQYSNQAPAQPQAPAQEQPQAPAPVQPQAPAPAPAPVQEQPQAPAPAFQAQAQNTQAQAAAQFNNAQGTQAPRPAGNLADMFNNGASAGAGDKFAADLGQAVLIKATKFVESMSTQHGPTDAMEAEWVVLDGPNQGAKRSGLIFATVVVNSLAAGLRENRPFTVGVIARGEAKSGKSAPYLLNEADENQVALAVQAAQAFGWV